MLGYAWSLLRPLLIFAILYVVFVKFLRIGGDVPNFPVYLLLGIVLWQFFADMTTQSLGSIVGRGDLIRKISIPRWIIVLSSSLLALVNLALNLIVISIFMLVSQVDISLKILLLPIIIAEIYIFALGLSLLLSALFVKYRDVGYIWEVLIQAGFYLTPILYPLSLITNETFQKLIMLNPMAKAIQDARFVTVTEQTLTTSKVFEGGAYQLIPVAVTGIVLLLGVAYFRKESKFFAENI